jgi:hypothetical protein
MTQRPVVTVVTPPHQPLGAFQMIPPEVACNLFITLLVVAAIIYN